MPRTTTRPFRVMLRINEETYDALKRLSKEINKPMASIITEMIEHSVPVFDRLFWSVQAMKKGNFAAMEGDLKELMITTLGYMADGVKVIRNAAEEKKRRSPAARGEKRKND